MNEEVNRDKTGDGKSDNSLNKHYKRSKTTVGRFSGNTRHRQDQTLINTCSGVVEFYLYPTVDTVLIHSIKPELTE